MRTNTFVSAALLTEPMPVLSVVVADHQSLMPQVLVTLNTEGPWRLTIPKGLIDFVVSDNAQGYSVRKATLTDISSNNGSAVSLAFSVFYEDITEFSNRE